MQNLKILSETMKEWSETSGDHHWCAHLAIEELIKLSPTLTVPDTSKLTKEDVGKTIYMVPTGNNVRRGGDRDPYNQMVKAEVIAVKRVNVELQIEGFRYSDTYKMSSFAGNHVTSGLNSGYYFFRSLEDLNTSKTIENVRNWLYKCNGHLAENNQFALELKALLDKHGIEV